MRRLSRPTVQQKLLTYFVYVCFFNFLLIAGVCFWIRQPSFFRAVKFIGVQIHCLDSAHNLLCMFTTFKPRPHKRKLYNNTLHNWASLGEKCHGRVRPILYIDNMTSAVNKRDALLTSALHLGWTVLEVPRVSQIGPPFIKDMYFDAARRFPNCLFYAYANGDILFDRGLTDTLLAVTETQLERTLVIGRRTNVRWSAIYNQTYLPDDVAVIAQKKGKLYMYSAIDYFIMSAGGYPWHRIPRNVVVGKPGYDNFLVLTAIRDGVSVIDATKTLLAVHQTDVDGNLAGHGGKHGNYNMRQLGRFNFRNGMTSSAQYETKFVDTSSTGIGIEKRLKKTRSKNRQNANVSTPKDQT